MVVVLLVASVVSAKVAALLDAGELFWSKQLTHRFQHTARNEVGGCIASSEPIILRKLALHYFCTFVRYLENYLEKVQFLHFENVTIIRDWY